MIWTSNVIFPGLSNTDKIKIDTKEEARGSIYDRNDKVLAKEGKTSNIGFVPGKMNKNPENDIKRVAELLKISEDSIKTALSASYVKEDTFVHLGNISENDGGHGGRNEPGGPPTALPQNPPAPPGW